MFRSFSATLQVLPATVRTMAARAQHGNASFGRPMCLDATHRPHSKSVHTPRAAARPDPCLSRHKEIHPDIKEVLFTEDHLKSRIDELGRELAEHYESKEPLVIGTLTGAFVFMADLVRAIYPVPNGLSLDFLRASSYEGTSSTGTVKLDRLYKVPVSGRHIILVEDIVDTGITAERLMSYLKEQGPASVSLVTLLDKEERRKIPVKADYVGFKCPNEFVVGYGLDHNEHYRSLPYVGVLKAECYSGVEE
eukprot:jgi/Botrbrau1/4505/Bobra.0220s0038.1